MIDIVGELGGEQLITFSEAARIVNPSRPVHISTIHRWVSPGIVTKGGERVRLQAVRLGGRRVTSREALQKFLSRLNEPGTVPPPLNKRAETACCPAHDDRHPSLSVTLAKDGKILTFCHAQKCSHEAILATLGLDNGAATAARPAGRRTSKSYPNADAALQAVARQIGGSLASAWTYQRADGSEHFRIARFNLPDGSKQFRPLYRDEGGWYLGDPPGLLPLYGLPDLQDADVVFVMEGEKCRDLARGLGLTATTSAHGAKAADKTDWKPLAGKGVVILPDNDDAGEKYAAAIVRCLSQLDAPPRFIKIVRLPRLTEGDDIEQFIEARDSRTNEEIAVEIMVLAEQAAPVSLETFTDGLIAVSAADIRPRLLEWLWLERIPLGKVSLLMGDPKLGKSLVTLDWAARVSAGRAWPDRLNEENAPGRVLLLSAEDDPEDTIVPRLMAANANLRKIEIVRGVRRFDQPGEQFFKLDADLSLLEKKLTAQPDTRLVIIDPVTAYLGRADSHKNAEVRALLAPLSGLAAQYRVAIVIVTHLNKNAGGNALYRAMGSLGFVATARAVWLIVKDAENPEQRLMLSAGGNLAAEPTGLAYTIVKAYDGPVVSWEAEPVTTSAQEALAETHDDGEQTARAEAADFLRELLKDGPVPAQEVFRHTKEAGFANRTVIRAKADLQVKTHRVGFGKEGHYVWALPHTLPETGPDVRHNGLATYGSGGNLCGKLEENASFSASQDVRSAIGCQAAQTGTLYRSDFQFGRRIFPAIDFGPPIRMLA